MSYLPSLTEAATSRMMTETFYGYDHRLKAPDGTWFEETGLSSRAFPLFAPRVRRAKLHLDCDSVPDKMICKEKLAWTGKDRRIYYDAERVFGMELTEGDKQLVSMGAYLCVFPDGVYVNTADKTDKGYMGNRVEFHGNVTLTMCSADGERYDKDGEPAVASIAPTNPNNGDYWIDTSDDNHVLKRYSASQGQWVTFTTVYVKIEARGIGKGFREQDGVTISGIHKYDETSALFKQIEALNSDMIIQKVDENYIIVVGLLDRTISFDVDKLVVERKVPELDFVCELDNRLWGCHYGYTNGKYVNTIYACAQGDPRNWFRYAGISTDSYAVNVGSDGKFTGMCAYGGYVLAFKERCIHKIYGTLPSNFSVSTSQCRGVAEGSSESLSIANEVLYYLTRTGVVAYDGSTPQSVFDVFGGEQYSDGRAGVMGSEYYICMRDKMLKDQVWCYDTSKGIWHHVLDEDVKQFVPVGSDLVALMPNGDVWSMNGDGNGDGYEEPVAFDAISGIIGYEYPDHKYISRFVMRLKMNHDDELEVLVRYDSHGEWESQGVVKMAATNSFTLPVIPRRCDHMQIRLRGKGDIRIFSIAKVLEVGSDA